MQKKRVVDEAVPYKFCSFYNRVTICVGDGLPDVPKKHFLISSIFQLYRYRKESYYAEK